MTFRLWISRQPATLQVIPMGFQLPEALAIYEAHIAEARRNVSRQYAPKLRRLPEHDADMLRWLLAWDPAAPLGVEPQSSASTFISSIMTTLQDVTEEIYRLLSLTDEDTLHMRDLCHVQYQMTAD